MAKRLASDTTLFALTAAFIGLGLIMVWSASSALAQESHGNAYYFLARQGIWAAVGFVAMIAVMRIDYRKLREPVVVFSALGVSALLLILVLFLRPVNETHRWIRAAGLSFQPAEFAKLTVILYFAYHLEKKGEAVNDFLSGLFPPLLLLGWFAFLIYIQPDLGSAATLVTIGCTMLFLAGVRLRYFATLGAFLVVLLYAAITVASYRAHRIEAFLDPYADPMRSGYQIIQSLIAVGTGGISGVGLMEGRQKLFYLPYPYSDFIFAVIGEELGLLGAAGVVIGFLLFLWRGIRAAWKAPDHFGTFLAGGLTLAIVFQALINVSVVLGLLPTKGIPLPFLSAGGSSLVLTLVSVGLVLNVSQHAD